MEVIIKGVEGIDFPSVPSKDRAVFEQKLKDMAREKLQLKNTDRIIVENRYQIGVFFNGDQNN